MKQNRLAAVDIGTNSIRSIIIEVDAAGKYRILDDEKVTVRLGEGLNRSGSIAATAWDRALEALTRQKKIIDGYRVRSIEAVATSAVRKASNGAGFIAAIRDRTGLEVEVISGEDEAELAALSAFHNFDLEGVRHLIFDIGGGSLELVTAVGTHIEEVLSLELGAVFLTEKFLKSDPVAPEQHRKLRRHIRRTLREAFDSQERTALQCMIGSGGTATSVASMAMAARSERHESVHGYELLRSEVVHLLAGLLRMSEKERRSLPGLSPDRCDIIVAGVTVIDELMGFFRVNLLRVNERGIREGLILRGLRRQLLLPQGKSTRSWRESALDFGRSCHFDQEHSQHIAQLAREIFKTISRRFGLTEKDGRLLEAAALLHDVGYFINYSGHHKHSYHLIRHADLFGFTPRERELIANIARYHRKSLPKKKHEQYARLSGEDQARVSLLGGIVRLCDGLDRRRNKVVETVRPMLARDTLRLGLVGQDDMSVELFGAKEKSDLFLAATGLKLVMELSPAPRQP
ncbi:MAG TPA: Ppx/GppA family phosphatase [Geobacter sp.]|nr:Ppx/GppA family phosphatase [Geobacter sp.]